MSAAIAKMSGKQFGRTFFLYNFLLFSESEFDSFILATGYICASLSKNSNEHEIKAFYGKYGKSVGGLFSWNFNKP